MEFMKFSDFQAGIKEISSYTIDVRKYMLYFIVLFKLPMRFSSKSFLKILNISQYVLGDFR